MFMSCKDIPIKFKIEELDGLERRNSVSLVQDVLLTKCSFIRSLWGKPKDDHSEHCQEYAG